MHILSLHILLFLFYYLFPFSFSPIFIYIFPCVMFHCFYCLCLFYFLSYYYYYSFFLHFPLSGPVLSYISLLIIPCMIVYVTSNKEPWSLHVNAPLNWIMWDTCNFLIIYLGYFLPVILWLAIRSKIFTVLRFIYFSYKTWKKVNKIITKLQ